MEIDQTVSMQELSTTQLKQEFNMAQGSYQRGESFPSMLYDTYVVADAAMLENLQEELTARGHPLVVGMYYIM